MPGILPKLHVRWEDLFPLAVGVRLHGGSYPRQVSFYSIASRTYPAHLAGNRRGLLSFAYYY